MSLLQFCCNNAYNCTMQQLDQLFRASGHRLTKPRREVFALLESADEPLSIGQLTRKLAPMDRSSVYRSLALFDQLGIIEIIHVGWKKRYELAGPFKPHHHHLQCDVCGKLVAIDSPRLEEMINATALADGYVLTSHHIELNGVCKNCREA